MIVPTATGLPRVLLGEGHRVRCGGPFLVARRAALLLFDLLQQLELLGQKFGERIHQEFVTRIFDFAARCSRRELFLEGLHFSLQAGHLVQLFQPRDPNLFRSWSSWLTCSRRAIRTSTSSSSKLFWDCCKTASAARIRAPAELSGRPPSGSGWCAACCRRPTDCEKASRRPPKRLLEVRLPHPAPEGSGMHADGGGGLLARGALEQSQKRLLLFGRARCGRRIWFFHFSLVSSPHDLNDPCAPGRLFGDSHGPGRWFSGLEFPSGKTVDAPRLGIRGWDCRMRQSGIRIAPWAARV